jgi:hypothetical protein
VYGVERKSLVIDIGIDYIACNIFRKTRGPSNNGVGVKRIYTNISELRGLRPLSISLPFQQL